MSLRERIDRYDYRFRGRLWKFAKASPQQADLLVSFPAACISIITDRGSPQSRGEAIWQIRKGAPLVAIAYELDIPRAMIRLEPEYFLGPLPEDLTNGAEEEKFCRRLLNHRPDDPGQRGIWLHRVWQARKECNDAFALWLAATPIATGTILPDAHLRVLSAYAWYSQYNHDASDLIVKKWSPRMNHLKAISLSYLFLMEVLLDFCLEHDARSGLWGEVRTVFGIDVVPLLTVRQHRLEGKIMKNCMADYSPLVLAGTSHLYSLRRNGVHVANMEVRLENDAPEEGRIKQLLGYDNHDPDIDTIQTAHHWLEVIKRQAQGEAPRKKGLPVDPEAWQMIWEPYWSAKGTGGILVPMPSSKALADHMRELAMIDHVLKSDAS